MKSIKIAALLLLTGAFAFAGNTPATVAAPKTGTEKPADSVIDQFLAALTGTEAAAEAAVKKFCTQEVIANGMIPMGKTPKIVKREGNCAQFYLMDDGEKNEYTICEENGKINVFEMYFGEEED